MLSTISEFGRLTGFREQFAHTLKDRYLNLDYTTSLVWSIYVSECERKVV